MKRFGQTTKRRSIVDVEFLPESSFIQASEHIFKTDKAAVTQIKQLVSKKTKYPKLGGILTAGKKKAVFVMVALVDSNENLKPDLTIASLNHCSDWFREHYSECRTAILDEFSNMAVEALRDSLKKHPLNSLDD